MDIVKEIMPILFQLVEEKGCAISLQRYDNEIVINIIDKELKRSYRSANSKILISNLRSYMQA